MVTKCSSMGLDLEPKEKPKGEMEVHVDKENGIVLQGAEDALVPCTCNYEDKSFAVETLNHEQENGLDQHEDMEVNIVDRSTTFEKGQEEVLFEDTVESMSSFGDTDVVSETEKDSGDVEVQSQLCSDPAQTSIFDGGGIPFRMRKKRLTDHWRRFIHPIMWRCKWIELQLKEFHNQALKYDRELAENEQRKQFDCGTFLIEDFHAKSLPFSTCTEGQKVVRRKKRKRLEETTDVGSYMVHHNLFSYYEYKNSTTGHDSLDDNCIRQGGKTNSNQELGHQDGWVPFESKDGGEFIEQIFRNIEVLQMQVRKLRARSDMVVNQIPKKFSSINMLSLSAPSNALNCSDPNHASPPENGASSNGKVMPLSNILESISLPQDGDSCENSEEQVLIHNQAATEEMQDFSTFGRHLKEERCKRIDMKMLEASEADLPMDTSVTRVRYGGKSLPKSRSTMSVTKRKRGKRKSVAGKRGKRCVKERAPQ